MMEYLSSEEESHGDVRSHEHHQAKKPRLSEDEKSRRCRERNRVHAKNTRDKKKNMKENMLGRFEKLMAEKALLAAKLGQSLTVDTADILLSLSAVSGSESSNSTSRTSEEISSVSSHFSDDNETSEMTSFGFANDSDEDDHKFSNAAIDSPKFDMVIYTAEQLQNLRRERNRIHAKNTRIKKKKMLKIMEDNISKLENELSCMRDRIAIKRMNEEVESEIIKRETARQTVILESCSKITAHAVEQPAMTPFQVPMAIPCQIGDGFGYMMYPNMSMSVPVPLNQQQQQLQSVPAGMMMMQPAMMGGPYGMIPFMGGPLPLPSGVTVPSSVQPLAPQLSTMQMPAMSQYPCSISWPMFSPGMMPGLQGQYNSCALVENCEEKSNGDSQEQSAAKTGDIADVAVAARMVPFFFPSMPQALSLSPVNIGKIVS